MTACIRTATPADLAALTTLLASASLPVADLDGQRIHFLVAEIDAQLVGVIGVEALPPEGLLRSLAVSPALHGSGLGRQLVQALEIHVAHHGIQHLTLLTETAAPFFSRLGYLQQPREQVTDAIRATTEFHSLCPASAICMHKQLDPARSAPGISAAAPR